MEGPGGYQFVGRTLQMWNRYHQTAEFTQPWLLRFFDQIRFYEVSSDELLQTRRDFPKGNYPIKIEQTTFSLRDYNAILEQDKAEIVRFTEQRQKAFDTELQHWIDSGQFHKVRMSCHFTAFHLPLKTILIWRAFQRLQVVRILLSHQFFGY
jgi:urea carboxylase